MYENLPKYNPQTKKFEKPLNSNSPEDSKKNSFSKSTNSSNENLESISQNKKKQNMEPSNSIKISIYETENHLPLYPIYEIFSEKFPDFICGICLSFVTNPLECATCSTIFCRKNV